MGEKGPWLEENNSKENTKTAETHGKKEVRQSNLKDHGLREKDTV